MDGEPVIKNTWFVRLFQIGHESFPELIQNDKPDEVSFRIGMQFIYKGDKFLNASSS